MNGLNLGPDMSLLHHPAVTYPTGQSSVPFCSELLSDIEQKRFFLG